jgi:hypothetical protein
MQSMRRTHAYSLRHKSTCCNPEDPRLSWIAFQAASNLSRTNGCYLINREICRQESKNKSVEKAELCNNSSLHAAFWPIINPCQRGESTHHAPSEAKKEMVPESCARLRVMLPIVNHFV